MITLTKGQKVTSRHGWYGIVRAVEVNKTSIEFWFGKSEDSIVLDFDDQELREMLPNEKRGKKIS